jgi:hypothetical protein
MLNERVKVPRQLSLDWAAEDELHEETAVAGAEVQGSARQLERGSLSRKKIRQAKAKLSIRRAFERLGRSPASPDFIKNWIEESQCSVAAWTAGQMTSAEFIDRFEILEAQYFTVDVSKSSALSLPEEVERVELLSEQSLAVLEHSELAYCAARYMVEHDCDELERRAVLPGLIAHNKQYLQQLGRVAMFPTLPEW